QGENRVVGRILVKKVFERVVDGIGINGIEFVRHGAVRWLSGRTVYGKSEGWANRGRSRPRHCAMADYWGERAFLASSAAFCVSSAISLDFSATASAASAAAALV